MATVVDMRFSVLDRADSGWHGGHYGAESPAIDHRGAGRDVGVVVSRAHHYRLGLFGGVY
ncbi:hypothetical protein U2A4042190009 [Corynebacterium striatum]|nr:hypothetical protein U2A4042190009 [Corynebacterium striatum]